MTGSSPYLKCARFLCNNLEPIPRQAAEHGFARQARVAKVTDSEVFQRFFALLIAANFLTYILDAQLQPTPDSELAATIDKLDIFFTTVRIIASPQHPSHSLSLSTSTFPSPSFFFDPEAPPPHHRTRPPSLSRADDPGRRRCGFSSAFARPAAALLLPRPRRHRCFRWSWCSTCSPTGSPPSSRAAGPSSTSSSSEVPQHPTTTKTALHPRIFSPCPCLGSNFASSEPTSVRLLCSFYMGSACPPPAPLCPKRHGILSQQPRPAPTARIRLSESGGRRCRWAEVGRPGELAVGVARPGGGGRSVDRGPGVSERAGDQPAAAGADPAGPAHLQPPALAPRHRQCPRGLDPPRGQRPVRHGPRHLGVCHPGRPALPRRRRRSVRRLLQLPLHGRPACPCPACTTPPLPAAPAPRSEIRLTVDRAAHYGSSNLLAV